MRNLLLFLLPLLVMSLAGCRRDMADQPRFEPLEENSFYPDGAASRPLPAHTIARGELRADSLLYTGRQEDGALAEVFPHPLTIGDLQRGRERFNIYCSPCHGLSGDGHGMIVQRGFPPPPSLHDPRLRAAPVGHIFEVISHGYGVMYPYAARVTPEDRWRIVAYIRALQLSQAAKLGDAPAKEQQKLQEAAL